MVQVALLQGPIAAAADQAAAALLSGHPSSDTSKAQEWIKQQANSLAAQTSLAHHLPKSELMFLPDVMTRSAHQASPATCVAAAAGHGSRSGDGGDGDGNGGVVIASHGVPVQADQQEAPGIRGKSAPTAASIAEHDRHLLSNDGPVHPEPVSWLEWEQQLQVTVTCPAPLAHTKLEGTCLCALCGRLCI